MKKLKTLNELAKSRRNKFAVMVIDETFAWKDDIAKKAGKIEGIYLVDLTKPTHCCEIAVSYPAEQIGNLLKIQKALQKMS